jgi:hypothetical protein
MAAAARHASKRKPSGIAVGPPALSRDDPRHELPGGIVLTLGLMTSSLCVVGLIILWLG